MNVSEHNFNREDPRRSVSAGAVTEAQVTALVQQGSRLPGATPSQTVPHDGDALVWVTTGETMSGNVAIVQRLGNFFRTQINGADTSPWR